MKMGYKSVCGGVWGWWCSSNLTDCEDYSSLTGIALLIIVSYY